MFLLTFCMFFSMIASAQNYKWEWALSGGGVQGADQIYDVKVGTDNNYYFIGSLYGTIGTQLNGAVVSSNNSSIGGNDIFLFSTTCDGTVRWSQSIGGQGPLDRAFNLVLDANNNVYVGVHINAVSSSVSFSPNPNHSTPSLPNSEAYKRIYLVKYNSNGLYQGRKALQGAVNNTNNQAQLLDLFIDNDTVHFITGLRFGTHLDNNVTVSTAITGFQYFIVKYDTNLNYVSSVALPIADGTGFSNSPVRFAYDNNLNRYYVGSTREEGAGLIPLTYAGKTVVNRSYILAFNGINGSVEWLREIYSAPVNGLSPQLNLINSLVLDSNSDIYVGGSIYRSPNEVNLKFYDPTDLSIAPYFFTPGATWTMPMITRLNSMGQVQWIQTTSAYNSNALTPGPRYGQGIGVNTNEVVLGAQGANEFWDNFQIQRPISYQPDPLLIRISKQTGAVVAIDEIKGSSTENQRITVVAADNDGNYIAGGTFTGSLFTNSVSSVPTTYSVGDIDFFVSKLAASTCGTSVSTYKFNKLNVNVYPNPTNDIVKIETEENLKNYEVYNVLGQQIQKGMFSNNEQINLHNATAGTYFIKVTTTQGSSATVKVVKN
ncbi:T9SS type A sorting domain-containing protein [Paenimyroides baculatum]|nr:T9SS type A sorting domain-containing protein [Paenimyroides baculatum]